MEDSPRASHASHWAQWHTTRNHNTRDSLSSTLSGFRQTCLQRGYFKADLSLELFVLEAGRGLRCPSRRTYAAKACRCMHAKAGALWTVPVHFPLGAAFSARAHQALLLPDKQRMRIL